MGPELRSRCLVLLGSRPAGSDPVQDLGCTTRPDRSPADRPHPDRSKASTCFILFKNLKNDFREEEGERTSASCPARPCWDGAHTRGLCPTRISQGPCPAGDPDQLPGRGGQLPQVRWSDPGRTPPAPRHRPQIGGGPLCASGKVRAPPCTLRTGRVQGTPHFSGGLASGVPFPSLPRGQRGLALRSAAGALTTLSVSAWLTWRIEPGAGPPPAADGAFPAGRAGGLGAGGGSLLPPLRPEAPRGPAPSRSPVSRLGASPGAARAPPGGRRCSPS